MNKVEKSMPRGLRKGSQTHKVFSTLISLMKKTGQEIKLCLDDYGWFDPTAIRKHYAYYHRELEDSAPTSKQMTESAIKEAIKRLELSDYIKVKWDRQSKQKNKISLTGKGTLEFIRYNIDQQKQQQKWDGKWRIIVFDVLEDKRQIRDLLRNRLKWLGFKELQKSVWILPYDVRKEIKQILDVCHIDIIGDVRFLTVEEMNDDEDLRKDFGID